MAKKLKVGVIGLGSMGSTHLDIYSQISEVEVVAVADPKKVGLMVLAEPKATLAVRHRVVLQGLKPKNILTEWI